MIGHSFFLFLENNSYCNKHDNLDRDKRCGLIASLDDMYSSNYDRSPSTIRQTDTQKKTVLNYHHG